MRKILLIDDRTNRQLISCNKIPLKLSSYVNFIENSINEQYENCFKLLQKNELKVDNYAAIMTHKSAFREDNQSTLYQIQRLCKEHNLPLVLFSGGISVNHYIKTENIEKLELNAKVFYSNNLKIFLDYFKKTGEIELMILGYGKSWRLNILLNILEKINLFVAKESEKDILYDDFTNATDFYLLEKVVDNNEIKLPSIENGWVTLNEIKKYATNFEEIVQMKIFHEK